MCTYDFDYCYCTLIVFEQIVHNKLRVQRKSMYGYLCLIVYLCIRRYTLSYLSSEYKELL